MTSRVGDLCDACRTQWLSWLDYRLPPAPIRLITIEGNAVRDVNDKREARYGQWRDTISYQQEAIADNCTRLHGAPDGPVIWLQGDLLAELLGKAA